MIPPVSSTIPVEHTNTVYQQEGKMASDRESVVKREGKKRKDLRLFKRRSSNTILLAGLSGSGKTVIFYQLRDGSTHHGTVTSMESNEGTFILHSVTSKKGKIKHLHLVDVPGHSRLRPKLDEYLSQAACIVSMIDAVEFLPNVRAASEAIVVKKRIPLLLLCNKVDKVTAHTKDFIRKQLEKEIDKLRTSRTAVSSADVTNECTIGVPGEAFAFARCVNKVTIAEASGLTQRHLSVGAVYRRMCKLLGAAWFLPGMAVHSGEK